MVPLWYIMVCYGILWYIMVCYGILWYIIVDYRILRYILVFYRLLWYIIHGSLTDHAGLVELVGIVGRCTKAKRPPRKGRGKRLCRF